MFQGYLKIYKVYIFVFSLMWFFYVNNRNNKFQQETDKEILYEVFFKNITSLVYIGQRRLYESCDWSEQCNGTHKANQCRYVGRDKICYCQDGYIAFNDMCLKGNWKLEIKILKSSALGLSTSYLIICISVSVQL